MSENELTYGIIREYANGTTLWFEPITDTLDGFILRKSDHSIKTVFSEEREAYISDTTDQNIIRVFGEQIK